MGDSDNSGARYDAWDLIGTKSKLGILRIPKKEFVPFHLECSEPKFQFDSDKKKSARFLPDFSPIFTSGIYGHFTLVSISLSSFTK